MSTSDSNIVKTGDLPKKFMLTKSSTPFDGPSTSTRYLSITKNLGLSYAVVRNIPRNFHSKDLRYFFAEYVENGFFRCFHFRHRPEVQLRKSDENLDSKNSGRRCCMISFENEELRAKFKSEYHLKFWTDAKGNELALRCFVFFVKLDSNSDPGNELLTKEDLTSMIEFRPPSVMPFGNVGTPSDYYLEQIRLCKLPASLIGKLGLRPVKRPGKYGAVPLSYSKSIFVSRSGDSLEIENFKSRQKAYRNLVTEEKFDNLDGLSPEEKIAAYRPPDNDDVEDNDDDQCEEWERHEALHDDVTEQDRTKPKKYEEEMEVTWEKGGPGLVWFTDSFQWNEIEQGTDTDWKWADDWDVDYSIYYDKAGCSMDAKQAVEISEDQKLRSGELETSVFRKKEETKPRKRRHSYSDTNELPFGSFEKHTKGIGSRVLRRYGWKPGKGLGKNELGKVEAVSVELEEAGNSRVSGQKIGFGYHGEQLQRTGFAKKDKHMIATVYDIGKAKAGISLLEDPRDPVLRSKEPTFMKYRQNVSKFDITNH